MALAFLDPKVMCCASRPEDRVMAGVLMELLLEADAPESSLCRFFQIGIGRLPLGRNAISALHLLPQEDFSRKLLCLRLPLIRNRRPEPIDYYPILPNVFLGEKSVATFLATQSRHMMGKLLREMTEAYAHIPKALATIQCLRKCRNQDLGMILESILPLRFPPLLIAYVNFSIMNLASPSGIELGDWVVSSLPGMSTKRNSNRWFKNFYRFKKLLFAALRKERFDIAAQVLSELRNVAPRIVHPGDKILCQALMGIVTRPIREREPSLKDLIRLVNELPRVHRSWQAKRRTGKVYGITKKAFVFYRQAAVAVGADLPDHVYREIAARSKQTPRHFVLRPPSAGRDSYFQGGAPVVPSASDRLQVDHYVRDSAIRIMANMLWEFGVRCVSFLDIELRHIVITKRFVSIIIPSSKGSIVREAELDATWLWPIEELNHVREFIAWLKNNGRYDPSARLTELAGMGRFEGKETSPEAYRAVAKNVRRFFHETDESDGLHFPRIQFAAWFAVRCLVARHRWLLQDPLLACCIDHPWFANDSLDRLLNLYPSECYSVLEIERRILMQASPREIALTYLRTLPLLVALWSNPRLQGEI